MSDRQRKCDEFYAEIYERSAAKQQTSLDRIKEAMKFHEENKIPIKHAVSQIGDWCKKKYSGPSAQTIRNSEEVLKKFVLLWESDLQLEQGTAKGKQPKKLEDLASRIPDQTTRAAFIRAVEERNILQGRVARLVSAFKQLEPVNADDLLARLFYGMPIALPAPEQPKTEQPRTPLSERAVKALRALLDPERLRVCALQLSYGAIVSDVTGDTLLNADQVAALKALLEDQTPTSEGQRAIETQPIETGEANA